eukprot:306225-Hanusia_phi.AAC.1
MSFKKRYVPQATGVLCGISPSNGAQDIVKFLKDAKLWDYCEQVPELIWDKCDPLKERKICWLNCSSAQNARALVERLNGMQSKVVGIEKYSYKLQAVMKKDIRNVDWSSFAAAKEPKTMEGIVVKKLVDKTCVVDCGGVEVKVDSKSYLEDWSDLCVGDKLRVDALEDNGSWVATDATLVWRAERSDKDEGRIRAYRLQIALMELGPQILRSVWKECWRLDKKASWKPSDGQIVHEQLQQKRDVEKAIGREGMNRVRAGDIENWDVTVLARLFKENLGVSSIQPAQRKCVDELRRLRNSFVHEDLSKNTLSASDFKEKWAQLETSLRTLASGLGSDEHKKLEKKLEEIKTQQIDQEKIEQIKDEFQGLQSEVQVIKGNMVTRDHVQEMINNAVSSSLKSKSDDLLLDNGVKYKLEMLENAGKGAMGTVHKATPVNDSSRFIAVKICHLTGTVDRSREEAKNLSKVKHKNVISYIGVGEYNGLVAIGMEFVVGQSYDEYLKFAGPLPWKVAGEDMRQVMEGMKAVHELSILHRDLKPSNLMRKANGDMIIVDFGLSKSSTSVIQTQVGALVGTPAYASPEQLQGQKPCPASDVFAIGVILYEALTERLPFPLDGAETKTAKLSSDHLLSKYKVAVIDCDPLPMLRLPASIAGCVMECLEKDKCKRIQTAADLLERWDEACRVSENDVNTFTAGGSLEFWHKAGFEDRVTNADLKAKLKQAFPQLKEHALMAMEQAFDADGNGVTEYEEFLKYTKDRLMTEIVKEFEQMKEIEPDDVFYTKKKVEPIMYKSSAMFGGGYKRGSLVLQQGMLAAIKESGGVKACFKLSTIQVGICARDSRVMEVSVRGCSGVSFVLSTEAGCKEFVRCVRATQAWQDTEVNKPNESS